MDYILGGLVIVMLWAFIRVTVRDPGPRAHGSHGGHDGDGSGDGGGAGG